MERILNAINNYFYRFGEFGRFSVAEGVVGVGKKYVAGQYVEILGSLTCDGVYCVKSYADGKLTLTEPLNEEFDGYVMSLAIPKQIISLSEKIDEYIKVNPNSSIVSESFGNYSHSKTTNADGMVATWEDVFKNELKPYRKMNKGFRHVIIHNYEG